MKREEVLKDYKVIAYRLPRKGELVLTCDNHCNYGVNRVTGNYKYIFADILSPLIPTT